MDMQSKVRCAMTAALLVVVWGNSHWSVALTLTLMSIANEVCAQRGMCP